MNVRDKKGRFIKTSRKLYQTFNKESIKESYWAGFIFGDGSIDQKGKLQICLSNKNKNIEHLQNFSTWLFKTDYVNIYADRCHIQITDKTLALNLARYGIVPNKTYDGVLKLPKNKNNIPHFIRGYFDADGWISINRYTNKKGYGYNKYTFGICSYLPENLEKISQYLPGRLKVKKIKHRNLYELKTSSKFVIRDIARYLYNGYCHPIKGPKLWSMRFFK